ncbi:MAG: hypothetical protein NC253_06680 [Ruminococcus sp.]|nr:hypothetical protein [Ruminococcus sp.]MCM1479119.1 hypothetical protein [Muribaculaceae bacterium]
MFTIIVTHFVLYVSKRRLSSQIFTAPNQKPFRHTAGPAQPRSLERLANFLLA